MTNVTRFALLICLFFQVSSKCILSSSIFIVLLEFKLGHSKNSTPDDCILNTLPYVLELPPWEVMYFDTIWVGTYSGRGTYKIKSTYR